MTRHIDMAFPNTGPRGVLHDSIAQRAYDLFQERGRTDGRDLDDWVQAERELAGERTYRVAILIIGSLFWDSRAHRAAWRDERLTDDTIFVHVPIRYGRLSASRANTYTMVLSNELVPDRTGRAAVVLCRRRVTNARDLTEEAEALWSAEQPAPAATAAISAPWGGVGLLCNPRTEALNTLRPGWTERVRRSALHYLNFPHAPLEAPALDPQGTLTIPWPTAVSGDLQHVDMLLATATRPGPFVDGGYPTPGLIAAAWKRQPGEARYFHDNRRAGITTADDEAILRHLEREN